MSPVPLSRQFVALLYFIVYILASHSSIGGISHVAAVTAANSSSANASEAITNNRGGINSRSGSSSISSGSGGASNSDGSKGLAHEAALSYLLYSNHQNHPNDAKLERLLKDSNHSHVSDTIDLPLADSIWSKMRQNALDFARQRADQSRPVVNRLLDQANVSSVCRESLNDILDNLAKLNHWAVRMYNSYGQFPAPGFFEGSHTSMGSYHQCVDVEPNRLIGEPQYCTYKFQPIVPKRPRYHNILANIENLANFTSKDDMFNKLASKAHYFYYTKLQLAACMPSKCERSDLESLGQQVAINTYLQYSGVSCLKKQVGFKPDGAQIFAFIILISLASLTMLGTIVHVTDLRSLFVKKSSPLSLLNAKSIFVAEKQPLDTNQTIITDLNGNKNGLNYSSGDNKNNIRVENTCEYSRLLSIIDTLHHFSIVKNGRKLFDTSTSTSQSGAPASLVNRVNSDSSSTVSASDDQNSTTLSSPSSSGTRRGQQSNDIGCVHGLRFWTICWIIFGHTMQYTEWAGFARVHQVEQNLVNFFLQPLLNATFSVDTFFLISGLLTTYVTWSMTRGQYNRFNKFAFLISRYLRLTPQVLLVILLFIVFPLMGDGPYWRGLIQKESDNCKRNWWVSALYLQAFVNQDKICNLVTWWLSIEMFYHFVSITVIIALLHSSRKGIMMAVTLSSGFVGVSCYLHYINSYPPNMLPTLPQRYEIWDSIVLKYFWTPYPHAPAYFVGLLLGYLLYTRKFNQLTRRQVRYGWLAFTICYVSILFGTYNWNNNAPYSRVTSTVYYNTSQVFWALATGWAILACALGHGGWLNSFLSSPIFIPLGRATYMTYLSHMLVVMSYPAKMNLLIEPSYMVLLYIFISNLFLAYALGILLTLVYESPILHLQKLLVAYMAQNYNDQSPQSAHNLSSSSSSSSASSSPSHKRINKTTVDPEDKFVCISLYTQPQMDKQLNAISNNNNNINTTTTTTNTNSNHNGKIDTFQSLTTQLK